MILRKQTGNHIITRPLYYAVESEHYSAENDKQLNDHFFSKTRKKMMKANTGMSEI